jgi:hypothetical protein
MAQEKIPSQEEIERWVKALRCAKYDLVADMLIALKAENEHQTSVIIASQNVLDIWQDECSSPGRLDIAMEDLEKALKKVKDTP